MLLTLERIQEFCLEIRIKCILSVYMRVNETCANVILRDDVFVLLQLKTMLHLMLQLLSFG